MASIKTHVVMRNDSIINWEKYGDQVLLKGEIAIAIYDDGSKKIKIGDGVTSWKELDWWHDFDESSFERIGEQITLLGFEEAVVGSQPVKDIDGSLRWVTPLETSPETLRQRVEVLTTEVTTIQKYFTPTGEDEAPLMERIGMLEEKTAQTNVDIAKYIEDHAKDTAELNTKCTSLEELVGGTAVNIQISNALQKHETQGAMIFKKRRYEIFSRPKKSRVSYMENEIRVMCDSNTIWQHQSSGENANPDMYYIGFKAYAPDEAASFREDLDKKINDETMYAFVDNEFAGTDEVGRKFSVVWLPVAVYDSDAGTWYYYGTDSTVSKLIGWYYTVEWYDENGDVIESDTIRINLSNKECHNAAEPYYVANVIKSVAVNGVLAEVENGHANIVLSNIIKSSKEIIVNEDGTLSIGEVAFDKVTSSVDTNLVLSGGDSKE